MLALNQNLVFYRRRLAIMKRTDFTSLLDRHFDVAVIGGGINGAAIARDASRRGLRVALVEREDFSSGTTAWSTRLIHGGLRYLEHRELRLVRESLTERELLLRNASHLVKPLELTIPIYNYSSRPPAMIRAGMILYDLLSYEKSLPRHSTDSARELEHLLPNLNPNGLKGGSHYYDAQAEFPERLVIENLVDADRHGAVARNYTEAVAIEREGRVVRGVRLRDRLTGREGLLRATAVINAAGPWVDDVLADMTDVASEGPRMGGTKGTHLFVHLSPALPDRAIYSEARKDGRPIFLVPWNDLLMIGTTDTRFHGDLDTVHATPDDVAYLLEEANLLFPGADLTPGDVLFTYSGVRPLPAVSDTSEGGITRKHFVVSHSPEATGLYSVIGGKLTNHRSLAEDVVDVLAKDLDVSSPSNTRHAPLPGNPMQGPEALARRLMEQWQINPSVSGRLAHTYGTRSEQVLELAATDPILSSPIGDAENTAGAEVLFAVREEQATAVTDLLFRRLMLGYRADLGRGLVEPILGILQQFEGWSHDQANLQIRAYESEIDRYRVSD